MIPFPWIPDAAALWGLALKITAVLGLAWLIAVLARRQPAATRHLVWLLAVGSVLALTILTPWMPPRRFALRARPSEIRWLQERGLPSGWVARSPSDEGSAVGLGAAEPRRQLAASRFVDRRSGLGPVTAFAIAVWLLGAITVLVRCAIGHAALRALRRAAQPADRRAWGALLPAAWAQLDRVEVLRSAGVGTPLTWGWRRATILLPEMAERWPRARLRAALLHELAHVARGDYLAQQAATLACALYWFHPLVWMAAGRLRAESERACDDRVLAQGTPADEYAETLLEVAARSRAHGGLAPVAIAMARRSQLEGRLLAVLDETRRRGSVPGTIAGSAAALVGCLLVPLAGLAPQVVPAVAALSSAAFTSAADAAPTVDERTVAMRPGERLRLDLVTGGAVEIHGWDRREARVRARLGGRDWRDTEVEVAGEAGGVLVRSTQNRHDGSYSTSHHFEIQVPRRCDVSIRSNGGRVAIVGVEGTFSGHTGGGEIRLDDVRGEVRLTTGGGEILVTDSHLDGNVSTGGGSVRMLRVEGNLRGSSGSGSVIQSRGDREVVSGGEGEAGQDEPASERAGGPVRITRDGGRVDLGEAPRGARISTGGGDITVGRAAGLVEATTGGGDIEIGPVAGSVRASTGSGQVRIRLDPAREPQSVVVHAGTGRVVIEVPEELDARIDLETAYTRSFGRAARIASDWELEREPTSGWDSSQGTPRRFVRAHGVMGNGRGRIQVRTVNGDITLRRVSSR